jgi:hypothetical protein
MTTCRLTVRAPEGAWQGEVSLWTNLVVLASLSAEPETLDELADAVRRYQPDHHLFDGAGLPPGEVAGTDELWCLIDLLGRTVVAETHIELPPLRGAFEADEDDRAEGFPIVWLDTPTDWLFRHEGAGWRAVVAERAAARAQAARIDVRAVLFGKPLLEHLAAGVLAAGDPVGDKQERESTLAIHTRWLLTARADLGGRTPREVLLADRGRISLDLEHRAQQWSRQGHAARPLSPVSAAYRLGGFGTTEVVLYFDLVRALLAEAWELAKQRPAPALLVERLGAFRDGWLREPNESSGPSASPAELIESERRRLPVTSDGSHLDCDCPICQASAEGDFGPCFMWFDGHHLELDDEFAFSLCSTREEWDRQQEEYRQFSEEMDRKTQERAAAGGDDDPLGGPVWHRSFVDWDALGETGPSPQQALLALTFPLAELVGDLQGRPGGLELLRAVNRAYGDLRTSEDEVARASAAQELRERLEAVSATFPDLTSRCADLQARLDEVLRHLS